MAGEIFIARQDTLENVQGTVNTIDTNVDEANTTTTAIKDETENIKADTEALKLSTETIDQIADTILERIGLTNDSGGGTTAGSIFAKLNALLSAGSGGITGFKHSDLSVTNTTKNYTTTSSGFLLAYFNNDNCSAVIKTNGEMITAYFSDSIIHKFGMFTAGAQIIVDSTNRYYTNSAHVFEFI